MLIFPVALALLSAAVHAGWNMALGTARDTLSATAVALDAGALMCLPVALATWRIDSPAWPWVVASATLEAVYYLLLVTAYDRGEASVVYPIARGAAPLMLLGFSVIVVRALAPPLALAGVLLIVSGIAVLRQPGQWRDIGLALLIGTVITAYTLVNKVGLAHAATPSYLFVILLPSAIGLTLAVVRRRGVQALRDQRASVALVTGAALYASFGIFLAAISVTPPAGVAVVQAVRETGPVMALPISAVFFGLSVGRRQVVSACLVVLGVVAVTLA